MSKYKLSKQILKEQKIETVEGNQVKINLAGEEIKGKIIKIEGDQVIVEGTDKKE